MKTIKAIHTKRYVLVLCEQKDLYYVKYETAYEEGQSSTQNEGMTDYNIASMLFDLKLAEFEGN